MQKASDASKEYKRDEWYNVPQSITDSLSRSLHTTLDHPISITRSIIESRFPSPTYKYHNNFFPIVSTHQNFDSLGFPPDHPGRSKTDTYYINKETVLRTHTSAHQADVFRSNESEGFLISADVYRRDAIDRSHYPIFHQMEGARMWDRTKVPNGDIARAVWKDIEALPKHDMKVEDPNPPFHAERNPLQGEHAEAEAEAIAAHLKKSLELMVVEISHVQNKQPNILARDWLEVLGCGVVKQDIMQNAGVPDQLGWAFGIGLERIAMLLFEIPDIRLFWSKDERFLSQFRGVSENLENLKRFVPFSKTRHVIKRLLLVTIIIFCWRRINYRSLLRTLTNEEANEMHEGVKRELAGKLGVELR
ncbi:hypothetical protein DID88_005739 [Monilinia fructigena]|uniref:Phenylalanine--tRNA ligase, mitochondrial n=1 Tax=Monilinia fructigena TaxID=38457 RepID=A0A395J0P2_9HELO|nr:hypothetical protein DID88_005739 [Monilinia fructigena]